MRIVNAQAPLVARPHLRTPLFLVCLIATLCNLLNAQESAAQYKKDLADSQKRVQEYVDVIRPKLFVDLSPAEVKIYRSISFRVTDKDQASSAISSMEDGQPIIEIGVGYGRQIEMMAEAVMIEAAQNRPVLLPYTQYVARQWSGHAHFVKDPTAFAHFNPDDLDDKQISAMAVNGMAFVLAHEVGHHVLHHYDRPMPKDLGTLRELEESADTWALAQCIKGHFSPLGGMLPLLLDYYLTANPVTAETRSDHPADAKRIKAMFEEMEKSLPKYRADIEKQGVSYEDYRRFVKREIDDYESQIRNDAPPVDGLKEVRRQH